MGEKRRHVADSEPLAAENVRLRAEVERLRGECDLARAHHSTLRAIVPRALSIAANLPGILFLADREGVILWIGDPPEPRRRRDLVGRAIPDLFPPEERAPVREALEHVLDKGESIKIEFPEPMSGLPYVGHFAPILEDGAVVAMSGFLEDVSARRAAEAERDEAGRLVREFARNIDEVFGLVTPGMERFFYVSPACERLFGVSPDTLLKDASRLPELIHPDDRSAFYGTMNRTSSKPSSEGEFRVAEHWFSLRARLTEDEGDPHVVFTIRDVTDHRRAVEHLRASRALYRMISSLNADYNFSMVVRDDGHVEIEWVTPNFAKITGYSLDELRVAARWAEFIHPDDLASVSEHMLNIDGRSQPSPIEYRIVRKDGEVLWVATRLRTVTPKPGERARALGATNDITHRKALEAERSRNAGRLEAEVARRTAELERVNRALRHLQTRLMRAERLRTAEDLAGSIAHSINNPLAALIGHVQMLVERDPDDDHVGRVLKLAERIRAVVERTLALFRKGALDLARHSPARIAADLRRELEPRAERRGVELEFTVEPDLPELMCDRTLLGAALGSLAENALDATQPGGRLAIHVASVPSLGIIAFRVEDEGPGIPGELREKVLEPFFTTKGGGTGLGLAIAQGIVQGHDGRLSIDARPGGGTIATVHIPVRGERLAANRERVPGSPS